MKLNKTNILIKTHFGLQIYVYILKQYYPNESLNLSYENCWPARNPFNDNKSTLRISIEDQLAVHRDTEREDLSGDCFDFANKYLKMATNEELYYMLNQLLHLGLEIEAAENLKWLNLQDDTWRPEVTFFKGPITNTVPTASWKLSDVYYLLRTSQLKERTLRFRSLTDEKAKRSFKARKFPYVIFSGLFTTRSDSGLQKSSDLMVLDFDDIKVEEVRPVLMADGFFETELLFTSPSGNGLKWVIRKNDNSLSHSEYFQAVSNYLRETYGLEVDKSGRDLSRACYLCHDPEAYLHPRHRNQVDEFFDRISG